MMNRRFLVCLILFFMVTKNVSLANNSLSSINWSFQTELTPITLTNVHQISPTHHLGYGAITDIALSTNQELIVSTYANILQYDNLTALHETPQILDTNGASRIDISNNQNLLAVNRLGEISIVDRQTQEVIQTIVPLTDASSEAVFRFSDTVLATPSSTGSVNLWSIDNNAVSVLGADVGAGAILDLACSPDTALLATALITRDRRLTLFSLSLQSKQTHLH